MAGHEMLKCGPSACNLCDLGRRERIWHQGAQSSHHFCVDGTRTLLGNISPTVISVYDSRKKEHKVTKKGKIKEKKERKRGSFP
uniref:Uncharacterized protein n=1 Tax=Loa loa TaxID=7209 RepID=A0A1I7VHB1_LOALO